MRVSVVGSPLVTVTDENGTYRIDSLAPGRYTLLFAKDGYEKSIQSDITVLPGRLANSNAVLSLKVVELPVLIVTGQALIGNTELGLIELRKESTAVQDAVSAELISKAGVGDAAGALKLVVGASVVDGKYATVRGLSDRYTGTTLNGIRVPSSDPRRRAVQIDVFPTATIESVTVTKTFTPDLQGDFTGGGVDIKTRSVPDGFTFSASSSIAQDNVATDNPNFLTYAGGGVGATGRELPAELDVRNGAAFGNAALLGGSRDGANLENSLILDAATRSLNPAIGTSRRAPSKNKGYSVTIGNRFDFMREGVIGFLAAYTEKVGYDLYLNGENDDALVNLGSNQLVDRIDSRGKEEQLRGALGTLVVQPNVNHEVALRYVSNQSLTDEARFQVQEPSRQVFGGGTIIRESEEQNQTIRFADRSVESSQLSGSHKFPTLFGGGTGPFSGLEVDYTFAVNSTEQDEPDQRFFRNQVNRTIAPAIPIVLVTYDNVPNSTDANRIRRIFRNVVEDGDVGTLNVTIPFRQWTDTEGKIKLGAYRETSDRDFIQDSFTYRYAPQFGPANNSAVQFNTSLAAYSLRTNSINTPLWTDVFSDPERLGLASNRCAPDDPDGIDPNRNFDCAALDQLVWAVSALSDIDYVGEQEIEAAYLMADLPINRKLNLVFGARQEKTFQFIDPDSARGLVSVIQFDEEQGRRFFLEVPDDDPLGQGRIDDDSLLPSFNVNYEIIPDMLIRGSWNETLARPTFRELAPIATIEYLAGDEFVGNPELVLSTVENADLRWEWFPSAGRVLAFSVFTKEITDPIEFISFSLANRDFIQPVNYASGRVDGWEFEARSGLGLFWERLEDFSVGLNYTALDSEVDVPLTERESLEDFGLNQITRRLQGQPEYLFNANLSYDNSRSGTSVALFYSTVGETLLTGAARGTEAATPNVFEKTFDRLDFNFRQKIKNKFSFSFKFKNVLKRDQRTVFREPDGDEYPRTRRDTASEVSLGIGYKW